MHFTKTVQWTTVLNKEKLKAAKADGKLLQNCKGEMRVKGGDDEERILQSDSHRTCGMGNCSWGMCIKKLLVYVLEETSACGGLNYIQN